MAGRVKTENENIYYSIDYIHRAIQENRQIRFTYLNWNLEKQLVPRENGEKQVSPWALVGREENYYLVAYDEESDMIKHYRVDKMGQVVLLDCAREGMKQFEGMDLASYTNQTFGMFGGKEEVVTMQFPEKLIGVVMDRFGRDVDIRPTFEGQFRVRARVAVSEQFFGWISGIGSEARIVAPTHVREEYCAWMRSILSGYEPMPFS